MTMRRNILILLWTDLKRMHELLNGLLDYSRVNTKGISFEPVNMNDVLESVKKISPW